jgi:hypothetical protein
MGQSETPSRSEIIFFTLLSTGAQRCCTCYWPQQQRAQLCRAKTNFLSQAKPALFGFSSSNFTVQDHIPSTAGDALTMHEA